MSKKIIDCVFFKGSQDSMKSRMEKLSEVVDKFVIFYKEDISISILRSTTKPIELIFVEEDLYIDEFKKYISKTEFDFEDIISISVTNEFYKLEVLEEVKQLLPFGGVILEKNIFHVDYDPVDHETQRGTVFFFYNHLKFSKFDVSKIWLGKQKYNDLDMTIIPGGYQI
jgi:hypothetical protein